jgi:tetratricopeptide (TPR) repeat protein
MNPANRLPWRASFTLALIAGIWAAPAVAYTSTGPLPAEMPATTQEMTETPLARLRRAAVLMQEQEYQAADAVLSGVMADPGFPALIDKLQLATYAMAASVALALEDVDRAASMFDAAVANPAATADIAAAALDFAIQYWRPEQAIAPIKLLAVQAPEQLLALDTVTVYRMSNEINRQELPVTQKLDFLQSLFDANWLLEDGRQPSALWRELAELRLSQGNEVAALATARRITGADSLLALQVDRRFDAIAASLGAARFDLSAALAQEEQTIRATIAADPRNLQNVIELTYVLLDGGRYQEVIDTCDAALAQSAAGAAAPAFDDEAEALPWIHDNRARGLLGVGRVDEAIAVWEAARKLEEDGGANVSQAINMASLYATLGKPEEALAALAGIEQASPYGWMEYHSTRLYALIATPDDPRARESLAYVREHRKDARSTHVEAMIRIGALDEASAAFREQLQDPEERRSALLSAQGYQVRAFSPLGETWRAQTQAFLQRPEIVAAIAAVGRVTSVPLHQLQF